MGLPGRAGFVHRAWGLTLRSQKSLFSANVRCLEQGKEKFCPSGTGLPGDKPAKEHSRGDRRLTLPRQVTLNMRLEGREDAQAEGPGQDWMAQRSYGGSQPRKLGRDTKWREADNREREERRMGQTPGSPGYGSQD